MFPLFRNFFKIRSYILPKISLLRLITDDCSRMFSDRHRHEKYYITEYSLYTTEAERKAFLLVRANSARCTKIHESGA